MALLRYPAACAPFIPFGWLWVTSELFLASANTASPQECNAFTSATVPDAKFSVFQSIFTAGGSSNRSLKTYIIDIDSLQPLALENIFVNPDSQELHALVKKQLDLLVSQDGRYYYEDELQDSLGNRDYDMSIEDEGILFHWNKYVIASGSMGEFEIVLPFSEIENLLTPFGKKVLR
jgi:hypothetical protein